jgi:hypothetical protein
MTLGAVSPGAPADAPFPAAAEPSSTTLADARAAWRRSMAFWSIAIMALVASRQRRSRASACNSGQHRRRHGSARRQQPHRDHGCGARRGRRQPLLQRRTRSAAPTGDTVPRIVQRPPRSGVAIRPGFVGGSTVAGGTPAAPAPASHAASLIATSGSRPLFQYRPGGTPGDR